MRSKDVENWISLTVTVVILAGFAGYGGYYLLHIQTITRIETLEKTCRAVN